jgi:hypothetical protein
VVAAMMAADWALAASGLLRQWDRTPPLLMPLLFVTLGLTAAAALGRIGRDVAGATPVAWLVGLQVFRLPLELIMHRAAAEGLMPVQMSYSGWNFDIVSGALALPVAVLGAFGFAPRGLILIWNLLGSVTLTVIVGVAIASLPMFAAFGPDRLNTWIANPPYIWLPGVLVPSALFGHMVIWRALGRRP